MKKNNKDKKNIEGMEMQDSFEETDESEEMANTEVADESEGTKRTEESDEAAEIEDWEDLDDNDIKRDIIQRILIGILVCICLYAAIQLTLIGIEYKRGSDEYSNIRKSAEVNNNASDTQEEDKTVPDEEDSTETCRKTINFKELLAANPDTVGWISFENNSTDYPIVQGKNNDYYLNHTFKGNENKAGCIFMDYQNEGDFSDWNTFIYGHNMKIGSMFGLLNRFQEKDYYEENKYFWIYTPEADYRYEIFSCYIINADGYSYQISYKDKKAYKTYLTKIEKMSMYDTGVTVTENDNIVTLSTCTGTEGERFLVHAVRVESYVNANTK